MRRNIQPVTTRQLIERLNLLIAEFPQVADQPVRMFSDEEGNATHAIYGAFGMIIDDMQDDAEPECVLLQPMDWPDFNY